MSLFSFEAEAGGHRFSYEITDSIARRYGTGIERKDLSRNTVDVGETASMSVNIWGVERRLSRIKELGKDK